MAGPPDSSDVAPGRVGFAENYRMLSTITRTRIGIGICLAGLRRYP